MRHQPIADAITRYVQRHPAAADTELGIAEWWLTDLGVPVSVEDVREALAVLESRGVMEMVTLHDGRSLWRLARHRNGA